MWIWERDSLKKGKESVRISSIKCFRRLIFEWFCMQLGIGLDYPYSLFQFRIFYDSVIIWVAQINLSWSMKLNIWSNFWKIRTYCECTIWTKRAVKHFCLCSLTRKLCVSWCNVAYFVWNLFCITLIASKARKHSVIIHPFIDLQFHWSQLRDPIFL